MTFNIGCAAKFIVVVFVFLFTSYITVHDMWERWKIAKSGDDDECAYRQKRSDEEISSGIAYGENVKWYVCMQGTRK